MDQDKIYEHSIDDHLSEGSIAYHQLYCFLIEEMKLNRKLPEVQDMH